MAWNKVIRRKIADLEIGRGRNSGPEFKCIAQCIECCQMINRVTTNKLMKGCKYSKDSIWIFCLYKTSINMFDLTCIHMDNTYIYVYLYIQRSWRLCFNYLHTCTKYVFVNNLKIL